MIPDSMPIITTTREVIHLQHNGPTARRPTTNDQTEYIETHSYKTVAIAPALHIETH